MGCKAGRGTVAVAGDFGRDPRSLREKQLLGGSAALAECLGETEMEPESAQRLLLTCAAVPARTQCKMTSRSEAFPKGHRRQGESGTKETGFLASTQDVRVCHVSILAPL